MLKKKTAIRRNYTNLISGEWIAAENNASGAIINMVPEFPADTPYRGNFQVMQSDSGTLNVLNTATCDEDNEIARNSSGELLLHWIKIIKIAGAEEKYAAQPRGKTITVPHLTGCSANSTGWFYLKMSRTNSSGDISFQDDALGDVKLRFSLHCTPDLPDDNNTTVILPLAAVIVNQSGEVEEIIQQQFGPGILWVPNDPEPGSSSSQTSSSIGEESSSSNTGDDIISNSPSSSGIIIDPPESSSSQPETDIIIQAVLKYNEVSIGDFMGTGVETHTANYQLTGTFVAKKSTPANGYTVRMTGTATFDFGNGDIATENIAWDMNVLQNTQRSCWDIFHMKINDWAGYYNEKNSEDDIDFSTPVYTFPSLQSMPGYPVGIIRVEHHLIYGATNNPPDNDLNSTLEITFTRK